MVLFRFRQLLDLHNLYKKRKITLFMRARSVQPLDIGGQAVIEGVMMKSRQKLAVAVRLQDGKIKVKKEVLRPLPGVLKIPFVRGFTALIYILVVGIKILVWSANQALGEDEEMSTSELVATLALSLGFALLFFLGIPFFTAGLFQFDGIWFNIIEGIVRLLVFVLYVYAISFVKDIGRMFQYHGAEHMAVNCYERGEALTVRNVQKYSTIHPRCGTSFIMLVIMISIVLFSFILTDVWHEKLAWRFFLIPVVAGISYEVLRLAGKFKNSAFLRILSAPGMWVQKITTQKPTRGMVEVAIAALNAVVR